MIIRIGSCKLSGKNAISLCILLCLLLVFNAGHGGLSSNEIPIYKVTRLQSSCFPVNFYRFRSNNDGQLNSYHFKVDPPEQVRTNSSSPLSSQNFIKTRPRGIPAQDSGYKGSFLSNTFLSYPPDHSETIHPTPFLVLSFNAGHTVKIRPPPIAIILESLYPA